jgi:hypothetical protein
VWVIESRNKSLYSRRVKNWYAALIMARISVQIPAKGGLSFSDQQRCADFADKLRQSMFHSAHENAIRLSSIPVEHTGVEAKPKQSQTTMPSLQTLSIPSNPKWGVHQGESFISSEAKPKLGRARFGYSMEVETQAYLQNHFASSYTRANGPNGTGDYLYNDPNSYPQIRFPVNFTNIKKGARPDWRLKLLSSGACEAIFDATSEAQEGHLIEKRVGNLTLADLPNVLYGAEIIYGTTDTYFDTSQMVPIHSAVATVATVPTGSTSTRTRFFATCVLVLGAAVAFMYYFDKFGGSSTS